MPEFTIRAERVETTSQTLEADTYEAALAKFQAFADSDLRAVSVTNEDGREVWEKPGLGFKIPIQDRDKINEALRQITTAMRAAGVGRSTRPAGHACPTCGSEKRSVRLMVPCGFRCDDPSKWHSGQAVT